MPEMRKSKAQITKRAVCSTVTLGAVLQYHPSVTAIATVRFKFAELLNQGKSTSKYFLRAADYLLFFDPMTTTQVILI
jgi:hypothetical protein